MASSSKQPHRLSLQTPTTQPPPFSSSSRDLRKIRYVALFLFLGVLLFQAACFKSPCQELSKQICEQVKGTPKLCLILENVIQNPLTSKRLCHAMLATWQDTGQKQIETLSSKYKRYQEWVYQKVEPDDVIKEFAKTDKKLTTYFEELLHAQKPASR